VVVGGASTTRAQTAPTSQAATAAEVASGVPLHTLAGQGNPNVRVERIDLSPSACANLLVGVPAARLAQARAQQCSMLHYSFHASHLPLSAGRNVVIGAPAAGAAANGSICCGFLYFTNDDELTDITNGNVWSANEWEDGVANGNNVYSWHNQVRRDGRAVDTIRPT